LSEFVRVSSPKAVAIARRHIAIRGGASLNREFLTWGKIAREFAPRLFQE
jgi:hypothetical protein